jgi:hypothetical protein
MHPTFVDSSCRMNLKFVFDTSKGHCTATQVTPLMWSTTSPCSTMCTRLPTLQQSAFLMVIGITAIAKLWHVEQEKIVSQSEVVTELLS